MPDKYELPEPPQLKLFTWYYSKSFGWGAWDSVHIAVLAETEEQAKAIARKELEEKLSDGREDRADFRRAFLEETFDKDKPDVEDVQTPRVIRMDWETD